MVILWAWLWADFFTGIVHFIEDKFLNSPSKIKFINSIKLDNDLHHKNPLAFTKLSCGQNINTSAAVAWPLVVLLIALDAPAILWMTVFFSSLANLVHRFSHLPKSKLNPLIVFMQHTGLFISFENHWQHHYGADGIVSKKNESCERFCVMTSWLNPILDRIKFFKILEKILKR